MAENGCVQGKYQFTAEIRKRKWGVSAQPPRLRSQPLWHGTLLGAFLCQYLYSWLWLIILVWQRIHDSIPQKRRCSLQRRKVTLIVPPSGRSTEMLRVLWSLPCPSWQGPWPMPPYFAKMITSTTLTAVTAVGRWLLPNPGPVLSEYKNPTVSQPKLINSPSPV